MIFDLFLSSCSALYWTWYASTLNPRQTSREKPTSSNDAISLRISCCAKSSVYRTRPNCHNSAGRLRGTELRSIVDACRRVSVRLLQSRVDCVALFPLPVSIPMASWQSEKSESKAPAKHTLLQFWLGPIRRRGLIGFLRHLRSIGIHQVGTRFSRAMIE